MRIGDLNLIKCLGKGSFGEVYLSTKSGRREYFATKKIDRAQADKPNMKKYLENEIKILNNLRHPNIVRLEEVKEDKNFYYIVMEYINGGCLTDCLKTYQKRYGRSFPEDIVQYLMRQIVDAIKYLHSRNIIHRDLKLDNIMVNFDNDNDKDNLNMLRAKIKIIDFGFAIQLGPDNLTFSALGSPINMDPIILKKFSKQGRDINQLGYDSKADIWSLGTICYEMLIGQAVFNAETLNDLIKKVENGSYQVPTNVSSEVVSFLNGMLQYNGKKRLSAEELLKHPFLSKNVRDFTKIDTRRVSKKITNNKDLNINVKRNQTIWSIFNEEKQLANIKGAKDLPAPEGPIGEDYNVRNKRSKTEKNIPRMPHNTHQNKNYQKTNTPQYPSFNSNISGGTSIYGQNMHPNMPRNQQMPGMQMPGMMPGLQPMPGMQPIPRMPPAPGMPPIPGMQPMPGMQQIPYGYPGYGMPMGYPYGGGMYPNAPGIQPNYPPSVYNNQTSKNAINQYSRYNNEDDFEGGLCSIQ